jgi:hypothetical protein
VAFDRYEYYHVIRLFDLFHIKASNSATNAPIGNRPIKCAKLKSSDCVSISTKTHELDNLNSHVYLPSASVTLPTTTTVALPLSCFIDTELQQQPQQQQQQQQQQPQQQSEGDMSPSFTVDLNTFKNNGMNIIFAPSSSVSSSSSSNIPLVLTFGHLQYPPT